MLNAYNQTIKASDRNSSNAVPSTQQVLKPNQPHPSSTHTHAPAIAGNQFTLKGNSQHASSNKTNSLALTDRVIRIRDVMQLTGLCRSSIYLRINASDDNIYHDPSFPRPFTLANNGKRGAVGWLLSEVLSWIEKKANSRLRRDSSDRESSTLMQDQASEAVATMNGCSTSEMLESEGLAGGAK